MARPSPRPVLRLSAKIDIEVIESMTRSTRKVPRMVSPPTIGGSDAATALRKTTSSSRKRRGKASSSARARSLETWSVTCLLASRKPPTVTWGSPASASRTRTAVFWPSSSEVVRA